MSEENKEVKMVEEEVPQSEINEKIRSMMPEEKIDYNSEMKTFIGSQFAEVEGYLKELKANKIIANYRKVPIGVATTLEMEPGRVTVVTDSGDKVIDIQVS